MANNTPAFSETSPEVQAWAKQYPIAANPNFIANLVGDTSIVPETPEQKLYRQVALGEVSLTPDQFGTLLSPENQALSASEFAALSPETQAWAKQNPQLFMQSMLANRNVANWDIGSIGAEGGYSTPSAIKPTATGLDYSGAGYMNINKGTDWGGLYAAGLSLLAGGAGLAGLGAAAGGTAAGAGAGGWSTAAEGLASQEAGLSAADLAGWGGATTAGVGEAAGGMTSQLSQLAQQYQSLGYNPVTSNALAQADILSASGAGGSSLAVQGGALDTLGNLNTARNLANTAQQFTGSGQQPTGTSSTAQASRANIDPVSLALYYMNNQYRTGQQDLSSAQKMSQSLISSLSKYL